MAGKVISIEIGYSLTRVCEVDYKSKTHKVYGYFSMPTPEGMINDGILNLNETFVADLREALAEYKRLYEHKTQKIVAIYEGELDPKALTEQLKDKLPAYMIPNRYEVLAEMPINLNGKIDRTLLKQQYIKEN